MEIRFEEPKRRRDELGGDGPSGPGDKSAYSLGERRGPAAQSCAGRAAGGNCQTRAEKQSAEDVEKGAASQTVEEGAPSETVARKEIT